MSKKRVIRILVILLVVVGFVGYFAFSTFLFSPLEGDFEEDVSALIPRDIDFFVAKAGLEDDFDGFPRLAFMDRLETTEAWATFRASPEYTDLVRDLGVEETLAELDAQLGQLPLGFSDHPQDIFGGRDLALAGYFRGTELAQADWAVYGRVNWMGKLGVALLSYPGLIGLEDQGLTVTEEEHVIGLSGGQLARPMYISRLHDVVVAGTNKELVAAANDLSLRSAKDSLLQSARYFDHIETVRTSADEAEVFFNVRKLLQNKGLSQPMPDPTSENFATAFTGRLFQVPSCKEIIGVVGFDGGVSVDVHGELSSELITGSQNRLYRQRGFSRATILSEAARLAPADTAFFAYLHGPIGDLLRDVLASIEPALRSNLEDAFRGTGKYGSLDELVEELDGALKNRLAIIARKNDYPLEMGLDETTGEQVYKGPPNDGTPVFAIAVIAWYEDKAAVESLRDLIGNNSAKFGLQGREPGQAGFFSNQISGLKTREYWSPFIPGTGVIAMLSTNDGLTVITNVIPMLSHVIKTYSQENYARLSDRPDFGALVDSSLHDANALVWFDPRAASSTLELQAAQWAEDNVQISWKALRVQEEAKEIPKMFPGKRLREQLTPDQLVQLDAVVDPFLSAYGERVRSEQVPALMAKKLREIDYLESLSAFLVMLKLDPKSFKLSLRAVTPLEE